jgi:hypothetical protein
MNDVLRALAISGGILSLVVIWIVIISIVVVKRGEAQGHGDSHGGEPALMHEAALSAGGTAAATAPAKAAKPPAVAVDEISVPQILLFGMGLFVVTVLALFGVSLVEHLQ